MHHIPNMPPVDEDPTTSTLWRAEYIRSDAECQRLRAVIDTLRTDLERAQIELDRRRSL